MPLNTSRRFWLLAGVTLLLALAAGAYGGYWIWRNVGAELLLRNQQAKVTIPEPMPVGIDILDELDIELDTLLATTVPIDQTLTLPIEDTLNVEFAFDSRVPIRMTVPIQQTLRLDQTIAVDGTVSVKALGKWVELPLKGDLPVQADIPLDVEVAIDQSVDLAFSAPAQVTLLDDLEVPLKADIETRIPLRTALSVPVRSRMRAYATILEPADALIAEMDLKLPIREIGLSLQRQPETGGTESAEPAAASEAP
ncbi:MAG: hypothetical protein R3175_17060 [Marinobacter sp.]|uniref:hypothetical protein n=1 Tax=Marinobacter sp. TaxID=50741 RepID=UPI00299F4C13|nr:hypothetical protein [Marinobacter sp.]MDX1757769.1 hypothetical protein [Marinobacter sp.]